MPMDRPLHGYTAGIYVIKSDVKITSSLYEMAILSMPIQEHVLCK